MSRLVLGLLLLSLALAGGLSYLASGSPDGLEHSLTEHGVEEGQPAVAAPMPDYHSPVAGRLLAGISGTLAVFGLTQLVGWALGRRREKMMHHRTVERLAAGDGPVHRLDPRVKLVSTLVFVVGVALAPHRPMPIYLAPALLVTTGLVLARLPFLFVLSRTLLVLPFVGLVAVFLPFTRGTTVLGTVEGLGLTVYSEGLWLALAILTKGVLAILAVEFLVFTTRFNRLLLAMRSLKVPRAVVAILGFLFRYLDLLSDESLRVRRARSARTPGRTVRLRGRSTGGMVGRLLLRALGRAERIHRAMVSRGFDGEVRILAGLSFGRADGWFVSLFVLGAGLAVACGHWLGGAL